MELFTLDELNFRLRGFDHGIGYNIIKPSDLNEASIKKGYLIMTSSEMLRLVLNLNLVIDLLIPNDNEHWQMYLLLRDIIIITSSDRLHSLTYQLLETVICEYLLLFTKLFLNEFKPKYHLLVIWSAMETMLPSFRV